MHYIDILNLNKFIKKGNKDIFIICSEYSNI